MHISCMYLYKYVMDKQYIYAWIMMDMYMKCSLYSLNLCTYTHFTTAVLIYVINLDISVLTTRLQCTIPIQIKIQHSQI